MTMDRADFFWREGNELIAFKWEGDQLVREHTSLDQQALMDENARIRNEGRNRTISFGRAGLRLSLEQYDLLCRLYPVLKHGSNRERAAMWKAIMKDSDYSKLRV